MSGNSGPKNRRKRLRLYHQQGGLCFWCHKPMQLLTPAECQARERNLPRNLCTLDHLEPRWHPDRGKHPGALRVVAACLECNNKRDRELVRQIPREILHEASRGARAQVLVSTHEKELAAIQPHIPAPKFRRVRVSVDMPGRHVEYTIAEALRVPLSEFKCHE